MNSTTLLEWVMAEGNLSLISLVEQTIAMVLALLIFIKSYDFEGCLKSVREKREEKRKEKERAKLLKFQKMLELARSNPEVSLEKIVLSEDQDSEEEKEEPVLKIAKKKKKVNEDSMA